MRALGLDLETTGFDTANDRITELGAVLWDTDTKTPLLIFSQFVYEPNMKDRFTEETVAMMKRVCGITPEILEEFGKHPQHVLAKLDAIAAEHGVEYIVAQNGNSYDKPLLQAELFRWNFGKTKVMELPWLDTKIDLPWPVPPDSNKLKYMACDVGFLNPFAHRAVFDVLTMLRVLSNFDIKEVVEYSKIPSVVMRAVVSYDQRDMAKGQRYSWEKVGDKTFPKCWVRLVKQNKIQEEQEICEKIGFRSVVIA